MFIRRCDLSGQAVRADADATYILWATARLGLLVHPIPDMVELPLLFRRHCKLDCGLCSSISTVQSAGTWAMYLIERGHSDKFYYQRHFGRSDLVGAILCRLETANAFDKENGHIRCIQQWSSVSADRKNCPSSGRRLD